MKAARVQNLIRGLSTRMLHMLVVSTDLCDIHVHTACGFVINETWILFQVEERKLEEDMERKEQERLEEILAMCAQYEQQIDSESKLNADIQSPTLTKSPDKQSPPPDNQSRTSPPKSLPGLTTPYLTSFDDRLHVVTTSSQNMPGRLNDCHDNIEQYGPCPLSNESLLFLVQLNVSINTRQLSGFSWLWM